MLPKRADPVTGALIGTIVLAALLALPVLILAVILWLAARAERSPSSKSNEEADSEFRARFQKLEETILDTSPVETPSQKVAPSRPRSRRAVRRPGRDQRPASSR
jgi:hypothetical protein